jgi:hypothetical protein
MADKATLSLTIAGVASTQLDILIKNSGAEPLNKALLIEFRIPLYLVSKEIGEAVERARQRNLNERTTAAKESLANVVTGAAGWSVWAATERTESLAVIRLFNDLDQTGGKLATPVAFAAGAQFNLKIPLTPQDKPVHVEIPYSYRYPNEGRSGAQTDGKLEMTSSGATTTPKVTLSVDHPSPTMISPQSPVKICWEIENGVSATLYGPLPGGNSQMSLSSDESATYKIRKGSITIYAVGAATYILQAEVKGARDKPNEMVVRTVQLDITSASQYSYLAVRPRRVMPHGLLEVDWAVWGIEKTWLSVGNDYEIQLKLTEQGASQTYQGSGVWRVVAPEAEGTVSALLEIQVNDRRIDGKTDQFIVAAWRPKEISFTGKPVGMAVVAPNMALLTTEGLWLAEVGMSDPGPVDLDFKKIPAGEAKARLAIAGFDGGLVVLQQTATDGLQLVRYSVKGERDGLAVDLPDTVQPMVRQAGTAFDVAVLGARIYVAVESFGPTGYRRAFSVTFKPQAQLQPEPLLEALRGHRLVVFDGAVFALSRATGRMFRFRQTAKGTLDRPGEAAPAVKDGASMIRQGLLVPVGRVLVVLGPSSIPPVDTLDVFGWLNYVVLKRPKEGMKQDLVYNPQQDHWQPCGRGLLVPPTAVAGFRATSSQRLWVVVPDQKAYTLSGAVEHLFSPEFYEDFPSKELPQATGKRTYTVRNESGLDFDPPKEAYRKAGLDSFSARGLAEVIEMPTELLAQSTKTFEFRCEDKDPAPVTVRYMAWSPESVGQAYVLEIDFSGPNHSTITSVFKRVVLGEDGRLSVADIPDTFVKHSPGAPIVIPPPKRILEGVTLKVTSLSGYLFVLRRRLEPITGEYSNEFRPDNPIKIDYKSPAFSLFVPGVGELRFDVDFALPHGIEISPQTVRQSKLIRIDIENAGPMHIDTTSFQEPNLYECGIRYRATRDLGAICIGNTPLNIEQKMFYLPAASAHNPAQGMVMEVDHGTNVVMRTSSFRTGSSDMFSVPNSVALFSDRIVAMFGDKMLLLLDYSFQVKQAFEMSEVIAMGARHGENALGLLCLKEEKVNQNIKYNYSYSRKKISQDKLIDVANFSLNPLGSLGAQERVAGAPAWIASGYVPPMAVKLDAAIAVFCVEGGLIEIDVRGELLEVKRLKIEGAGRGEAVMYARDGQIFCAHSHINKQSLLVSSVELGGFNTTTVSLPGAVTNLANDTRPLKNPALRYKVHSAVSLYDGAPGAVFASHGKTIYYIQKDNMAVQSSVTVDLPCRLIRVKHDWPPHGTHPIWGAAQPCWIVDAIGCTYTGDGTKPDVSTRTDLYKLGFD